MTKLYIYNDLNGDNRIFRSKQDLKNYLQKEFENNKEFFRTKGGVNSYTEYFERYMETEDVIEYDLDTHKEVIYIMQDLESDLLD